MATLRNLLDAAGWIFGILIGIRAVVMVIGGDAPDFSVYYFATLRLISGGNPYTDPTLFTVFAYPPFTNFLIVPFSMLPYAVAKGAWASATVIAYVVSVNVAFRLAFGKAVSYGSGIVFFFFMLSFPARFTIGMGQINGFALWFFLVSLRLALTRRHAWAGMLFGLAVLTKPQLILLLPIFLLTERWETLRAACVALLATGVLGFVLYTKMTLYYFTHVVRALSLFHGQERYYNQGIRAIMSRLIASDSTILYTIFAVTLYGFVLWFIKKRSLPLAAAASMLLPVILLIEPISWQHHYIFLLFPFLFAFRYALGFAMRLLVVISYALVAYNIRDPATLAGAVGSWVTLSHVGWGTILLTGIMVRIVVGTYARVHATSHR